MWVFPFPMRSFVAAELRIDSAAHGMKPRRPGEVAFHFQEYRGGSRIKEEGRQSSFLVAGKKRPGHDGRADANRSLLGLRREGFFQGLAVEMDFGGGNLFGRRALKAEFANSESAFHAERRPEDSAGHGTRGVQVAEAGCRIEDRTRLVIGKVFEVGARFVERARDRIAGKTAGEARDRHFGAAANRFGSFRVDLRERGQALAKASGVEFRNGKDADAALGAAGCALQP